MAGIYFVGGCKGGVGKSFFAMALVDYLLERDHDVLLIETDTSNPDVAKIYGPATDTLLLDLDQRDSWALMINQLDDEPHKVAVINSAARNDHSLQRYGPTLAWMLDELKRPFATLWLINRQRDSLELLRAYRQVMDGRTLHVIRNLYFGSEDKFELYNRSELRQQVEHPDAGGRSLNFPDLGDRVADLLYNQRLPIRRGRKELQLGDRAELIRWANLVHTMLAEVVDD